jgi:hypothetical protein
LLFLAKAPAFLRKNKMEHFRDEIEESVGGLDSAQKEALDEAHRIYHTRLNGALPFATQIAIVMAAKKKEPEIKVTGKLPPKKKAKA